MVRQGARLTEPEQVVDRIGSMELARYAPRANGAAAGRDRP
jgi:hypothetical protein